MNYSNYPRCNLVACDALLKLTSMIDDVEPSADSDTLRGTRIRREFIG